MDNFTTHGAQRPILFDEPRPSAGGYGVVISANVLVAIIIVVALWVNAGSAVTGIIAGSAYYFIATNLSLLILSGTLGAALVTRQEQITMRRLHELQWNSERKPRVAVVQTPDEPSAPLLGNNFVSKYAPVDDSARREAIAFGLQLYGSDGLPDPKKIVLDTTREAPGRLRLAAPRGDARKWLLDRDVLVDLGNGFALSVEEYPTLTDFRALT